MPRPSLEYEEEDVDDLFGSDDDTAAAHQATILASVNPARAVVAGPSGYRTSSERSGSLHAKVPSPSAKGKENARDAAPGPVDRLTRLEELRSRRSKLQTVTDGKGVGSLKYACMTVIKTNAARVWDVGDLEYTLIRPFIDELHLDQLAEIEEASPHIRDDTDWLWELFLLQDYPLFHERCRERKGAPRTSGWRRMYQKAKDDAKERQELAVSRVAERYRQLEEEKASKRIVVVDRIVPTSQKRKTGWGRGSASSAGSASSSRSSASIAIAKAKADSQRARVALTHASGKYIPPPVPKRPSGPGDLYKNPYLAPSVPIPGSRSTPPVSSYPSSAANGPRLPPPRSRRPIREPDPSPIPGSYRTTQVQDRASLPEHLKTISSGPVAEERFRLPSNPKRAHATIRRPVVENFEPPRKATTPSKARPVDFFGDLPSAGAPPGLLDSLKRAEKADTVDLTGDDEEDDPRKRARFSSDTPRPLDSMKPAQKEVDQMSVLFRKRPKAKPPSRQAG